MKISHINTHSSLSFRLRKQRPTCLNTFENIKMFWLGALFTANYSGGPYPIGFISKQHCVNCHLRVLERALDPVPFAPALLD